MLKIWDKSKIDVYFEDELEDKFVRQGFNNLVEDAGENEISEFLQAIHSLNELPVAHAIVQESYRYLI